MRPGSQVRVLAFEPGVATFLTLCHNVAINQVDDRLVSLPIALSDTTTLATFNYRTLSAGSAAHVLETNGAARAALGFVPVYRQQILTYRLDDVVREFELPPPNHLKIDVDGYQSEVLRGAPETLRSPQLRSIMIEVPLSLSEDVQQLLDEAGLALHKRIDPPSKKAAADVWYGVFVRG
jgi:FkbM family methyltransferase